MAALEPSTDATGEFTNDNGYYKVASVTTTAVDIIGQGKTLAKDGNVRAVQF